MIYKKQFLGFEIRNTGNGDGYVLLNEGNGDNLGNFSNPEKAKRHAVVCFMVNRPNEFIGHVTSRVLYGWGLVHEFYKLERVIIKEGFKLPQEITKGPCNNMLINVCGAPLMFSQKKEPVNQELESVLVSVNNLMVGGLLEGSPLHQKIKNQLTILNQK